MIDPDDPPRTWTVVEANAALPRVAELAGKARARAAVIRGRGAVLAERSRANGHADPVGPDVAEIQAVVGELEAEGIVLRDIDAGLVDFPARAPSGRGYWLCWVVGEDEVAWWHWPEDGFAGRTPLTQPPG